MWREIIGTVYTRAVSPKSGVAALNDSLSISFMRILYAAKYIQIAP